jgi:hypothetical protein
MKSFVFVLILFATPVFANENKISQSDKQLKNMTVAQFKGDCIRMRGMLSYHDKQWTCTGKDTEKGLTSIPVSLPK